MANRRSSTSSAPVRKAVIPAAGLGTRFLPVTKAVPKELLPIGTTPALEIVVAEAVASGVEEIVLVASPHKPDLASYFSPDTDYDRQLDALGKGHLLAGLRALARRARITSVAQEEQRGLGHAVLCARQAVGREPFLVILPDVIFESEVPCCRQLIEAFEGSGVAVNAAERSPREKLHLYGVYDIASSDGRFHRARRVIEKPKANEAPSDLSVGGRYLFPPDVFDILAGLPPGRGGEIQLADAMDVLAREGRMIAYEFEGRQFDTGDPEGYLKANIFYGRKANPAEVDRFMRELLDLNLTGPAGRRTGGLWGVGRGTQRPTSQRTK